MKSQFIFGCVFLFAVINSSCNGSAETDETENPKTPVTVVGCSVATIEHQLDLLATSTYRSKTKVNANTGGTLIEMKLKTGDHVNKGDVIAMIQTKESLAISTSQLPDSLKQFSGKIKLTAAVSGIVTSLLHQQGDYIQDGETIAEIADANSLAFTLNVPYENHLKVSAGQHLNLQLPDGTVLSGVIGNSLYQVDATQAESFFLIPDNKTALPENLVAHVFVTDIKKENVNAIVKQAVLANETMTEFWVMKLLNDSTAIKTDVQCGIQNDSLIEIISPSFAATDRFVLKGNYGLADTALITLEKN